MRRTHVDLFSGLGGFALSAKANGVKTIQFVEIDRRCREFLQRAWPGVPVWDDIKTFRWQEMGDSIQGYSTGDGCLEDSEKQHGWNLRCNSGNDGEWRSGTVFSKATEGQRMADAGCERGGEVEPIRRPQGRDADRGSDSGDGGVADTSGRGYEPGAGKARYRQSIVTEVQATREPVWLLTAGVPCQPASRAGKQRGKGDDRWLWDAAIKVLADIRPAWAIFENVSGLADVGLAGILADLEAVGYELPRTIDGTPIVLHIGACAVGAPHRRMRYWIVAHRSGERRQQESRGASEDESQYAGRATQPDNKPASIGEGILAHSDRGRQFDEREPQHGELAGAPGDEPHRCSQDGRRDGEECVADAGGEGHQGADPECGQAGLHSEHTQGNLADSPRRGQRIDGSAPGQCGHADQRGEGGMGDSECPGNGGRRGQAGISSRPFSGDDRPVPRCDSGFWDNSIQLPCADGKVRRAPDDTQRMAHGLPVELLEALVGEDGLTPEILWDEAESFGDVRLTGAQPHRSLLAALGNAVVWQVPAQIIKAMIEAEDEN